MKENTPSCYFLLCPFHHFAVPLPRKRGRLLDYGIFASPVATREAVIRSWLSLTASET